MPVTSLEELADNFELLGDWDTRYQYLMDLGNRLGTLPEEDKTDATKVHGCMSNVWIVGDLGADGTVTLQNVDLTTLTEDDFRFS